MRRHCITKNTHLLTIIWWRSPRPSVNQWLINNNCYRNQRVHHDFSLTLSKAIGRWHRSRSGSMRRPGSAWEERGRAAGHTLLAELHGALPPPHHACSHPHIRTEKKRLLRFLKESIIPGIQQISLKIWKFS